MVGRKDTEGRGRSVLVTGCSSGVGRALMEGLHAAGYDVCATARRPDAVAAIRAQGIPCWPMDYTDSASIVACWQQVMEHTGGRLYGLVNNGGYGQPGAIEDVSRARLLHQFEANVFGWHELTQLAVHCMRPHGEGRVVNIGSTLAFYSLSFRGPYAATKHALEALTWALRLELHGSGIQVALVEPGPLQTEMRAYGYRMLMEHIDVNSSRHQRFYRGVQARLFTKEPVYPNTLQPQAVLPAVRHALAAKRAKARYFITVFDRLVYHLVTSLPERLLEAVLRRASATGNAASSFEPPARQTDHSPRSGAA